MQAAREYDTDIILVGQEDVLKKECGRLGCRDPRLSIRHAPQIVEMHESPSVVARKKRDSSIWVATGLVKSGEANAVVSPGNTGASMVAAFFILGLTKGVERPAIATQLPTLTGTAVMLDVGANVDCSAEHLEQFALMGHEYAQHLYGKPNPRVGLLSIGEEDTKGNEVTKEAFPDPTDTAWHAVEIKPVKALKKPVTLADIKANKALANIYLVRQPRFSVMPLTKDEYEEILSMSK